MNTDVQKIPLQLSQDCLIASVQIDLSEDIIQQFRQDLLDFLAKNHARGVIIDVSGVEIMDLEDFQALRQTLAMAVIMGVDVVLSGLRPGVVSALIDLDADISGLNTALNLDEAFRLLVSLRQGKKNS